MATWDAERAQFVLTAEDGIRATDTIYLEPHVYEALVLYADSVLNHQGGKEGVNA